MASATLVLAAQTNGRGSKGPTTPAGKRKSSANSYKHGLFSQSLQTDEDCDQLSRKLGQSFQIEFQPVGDFEQRQVAIMAASGARYLWAARVQAGLLDREIEAGTSEDTPEFCAYAAWQRVSAAMERVLRLQSRFDRNYFRALDLLRKSQEKNRRTESAQSTGASNQKMRRRTESKVRQALPTASLIAQLQKMEERTRAGAQSAASAKTKMNKRTESASGLRAKPMESTRNRRPVPGILSIYEGR